MPWAKERTGYPAQKPIALYERIIRASSNPGDMVLDPFAGCATTCVAAERLGRQWAGIDIWNRVREVVVERLTAERRMFAAESVRLHTKPPARTDEQEVAAPNLELRLRRPLEPWQTLTNAQTRAHLEEAQRSDGGIIRGGCGRVLEAPFMHLDHKMPRADGGENWITNRILLCQPCNGYKGATLTLTGLRRRNAGEGWMQNDGRARLADDSARRRAHQVRDEASKER